MASPSTDRVVLAQWSIPYFTGLPEDVVTNNLHFIYKLAPDPTTPNFDQLSTAIKNFYDAVYGVLGLAPWCQKSQASVTYYDLTQPTPRVPIMTSVIPVTNVQPAGSAATEVAVCLSFSGDLQPGIPPARQRGRIFIGGLTGPLAAGSSSSFPMIPTVSTGICATAMKDFKTACDAIDWLWVVYSPTQHAVAGQETFEVVSGWVDNTADTQRRRGVEATLRSVWP